MTPPRGPAGKHRPYLRPDGVTVYRVDTGRITAQGTRERLTVSSKDPREAKRKYRELMRHLAAGNIPTAGTQGMTVRRWAEEWLPMHQAKVRPTTFTTDAGAVRKWILPTVGHRRLNDLTPADLRELRSTIVKAGRSTTTALHAHKILVKLLKDAIIEGHSVPQRVLLADKPGKATNDRQDIPVDHALRILAVVGQRDDASRWLFGMMYGVRQGEALGLTWDAVDLEGAHPCVLIEWQLQNLGRDPVFPDGFRTRHLVGSFYLTETKTARGERALPLVPIMAASLAAAKATWEPNPYGLVWTHDGEPIRDHRDRATWKAIQAQAGVAHPSGRPWHLHECRHTVITLLKRAGTADAVIETIVGQSQLVKSYLHLDGEDARSAMEALSRLLEPPTA